MKATTEVTTAAQVSSGKFHFLSAIPEFWVRAVIKQIVIKGSAGKLYTVWTGTLINWSYWDSNPLEITTA